MVPHADAVAREGTVVIHAQDTACTDATVMSPRRLPMLAVLAIVWGIKQRTAAGLVVLATDHHLKLACGLVSRLYLPGPARIAKRSHAKIVEELASRPNSKKKMYALSERANKLPLLDKLGDCEENAEQRWNANNRDNDYLEKS